MTRLKSRVRQLEKRRGSCPVCRGEGRWIIAVLGDELGPHANARGENFAGSPDEAEAMPGCPGCALEGVIVLRYVEVSGITSLDRWHEEAATA